MLLGEQTGSCESWTTYPLSSFLWALWDAGPDPAQVTCSGLKPQVSVLNILGTQSLSSNLTQTQLWPQTLSLHSGCLGHSELELRFNPNLAQGSGHK